MAVWSMPITSASAALSVFIRRRQGQLGIAALRLMFQPQSKDYCDIISPCARQVKTCASSSLGTQTRNYENYWPVSRWTQFPAICRRLPPRELLHTQLEATVTSLFPMFLKLAGKQC